MGEVYLFSFLAKTYAPLRMLCLFVQDCDSICVVAMGATFFGAWLRLRTFLYADRGRYMRKKKRVIDITSIELMPGEPAVCLGNGKQGFECCCDECDYYLFCFSEFHPKSKEENNAY